MRFSNGRTYNTHDTRVDIQGAGGGHGGRIVIDQTRGVRARCELSLNALLRFGPKGASAEMISGHLNGRLKANYSTTDISYALNRLVAEGIIKADSYGRGEESIYRASKVALDHWRKLPKS